MLPRNADESSVTKKRKVRICELEITYNFKDFIYQTKVGPPLKHKRGNAQGRHQIMKLIPRLQKEKGGEKDGLFFSLLDIFSREMGTGWRGGG